MNIAEKMTIRDAFNLHYHKGELGERSHYPFLAAFRQWERLTDNLPVEKIDNQAAEDFRRKALDSGLAEATINGYWRAIRRVLRRIGPAETRNPWGLGLIAKVPAMRPVKEPFRRPRRISLEELSLTYIAARGMERPKLGYAYPGLWWQSFLVFAYFTGLRVSDIMKAKWSDLDLREQTIFVRTQKTGVEADLPLHPAVIAHLERLNRDNDFIFKICNRRNFYSMWAELKKLADITFGPHDIRRTAASEVDKVDRGMGKVLGLWKPQGVFEKHYLNALPELRTAVEKMDSPLAFRHGIKMTDRAVTEATKVTMRPSQFTPPMQPPVEAFAFAPDGFAFLGEYHRAAPLVLAAIRCLVENGCSATGEQIWQAVDDSRWKGDGKQMVRLRLRISDARIAIRNLLGLSASFNPITQTHKAVRNSTERRYGLFLPPSLWQDKPAQQKPLPNGFRFLE